MKNLKELYKNGVNLCAHLRKERGLDHNTVDIIKKSYNTRAGMDVEMVKSGKILEHNRLYTRSLASIILSLCEPLNILEAGVGEAITLAGVLRVLKTDAYGFDISDKRIGVARKWLKENKVKASLKTGNLLRIPYPDNRFDVVYTSHAIEPNGGKEKEILRELYRVTKKYLILLEPGYEFASKEYQKRMDSLCYVKYLAKHAKELGYNVIVNELYVCSVQIENPTAITIIKK